MNHNPNKNLVKTHDIAIGVFYFYKNFLISEIKEGILLSVENSTTLFELIKTYYGNETPFFYIANRINSYSFAPTGHYKFVELYPNAKGFAVVTYNAKDTRMAKFEKSFVQAPAKIFDNLEEAIEWGTELIARD
ncbi:hypothetical protein [Aquimarina sp. 2201CG14-23]|uniref:hypothetical protein n=1 Tax=Aquimarina mycalae TaxID=3040073 RepID=UPI002477EF35|nr:hypothetical protein [Aquimarina sp. 2201CG14-23]MDH7444411.1 hypothetical protein [Aquimarina sp. 2201CG14-23]